MAKKNGQTSKPAVPDGESARHGFNLKGLLSDYLPAWMSPLLFGLLEVSRWADHADKLFKLGDRLPILLAFFDSSLFPLAVAFSFSWVGHVWLTKKQNRRAAYWAFMGCVLFSGYSAFLLGQRVPPPASPSVALKFFDPFLLDENNAPIARVSGRSVRIPLRASALLPFATTHRAAAICRPVTPGVSLENDDFFQIGLFQEIREPMELEMLLGEPFLKRLCRNPAMQCGMVVVKNDVAKLFNAEMKNYRAGEVSPKEYPSVDTAKIEHSVIQLRPIVVEAVNCEGAPKL